MFDRLKNKWGVKSNLQLFIIFIVFGITGSLSVVVSTPFLDFFDFNIGAFEKYYFGAFIYYFIKVAVIFPLYNVLLILTGTLFFQFNFFWNFQKKIFKKIGFIFLFKKKKDL